MGGAMRGPLPWLSIAFAIDVVITIGAAVALSQGTIDQQALTGLTLISLSGAAMMFALSWKVIDFLLVRSVRRLAAEARAIAHGGAKLEIDNHERYTILMPLPEAINELSRRLDQARRELTEGLRGATAKSEENAARLAAILNDLHEGVVVCNLRHQVVLYNQVAMDMLAESGQLGLSRSLFETVARAPVIHMMGMLTNRPEMSGQATPFLAGSANGDLLLQARMTLIRDGDGGATGYVITLVDARPQVAALTRRDALLRQVTQGVEAPLACLRWAAGNPAIVEREAANIERAIKSVTDGYQSVLAEWWPMSDLLSTDLCAFIANQFEGSPLKLTITGLPVWLHADSHSLVLALGALIREMAAATKAAEFDISAEYNGEEFWLGLMWDGGRLDEFQVTRWLELELPTLGGMTVKDVLDHHAGSAVSHGESDGRAWLRLPMKKGVEVHFRAAPTQSARPEFYDMSLLAQASETGAHGGLPLRSLTFVVFDTETTGLSPSTGDQIVQIGAVRVVNGRILSGEVFNRIINPGRPIPPESIRFHGITDEMVIDKPPLEVVLPQFKAFAADAVLVAHNAAFDLKFIRMRERECGVAFDNPILDTMILSSYLDGQEAGNSLDDVCSRLGIGINDRHTALGDSMVTAAVLLHQIAALEMRGITTLDQAVQALNLSMVLHQRQQAL